MLTLSAASGLIMRFLGVGIVTARETAMMTAFCIVLALVAAGFFTELMAAASAPLGYQDESGFHFGRPKAAHPTNSDLQNPS